MHAQAPCTPAQPQQRNFGRSLPIAVFVFLCFASGVSAQTKTWTLFPAVTHTTAFSETDEFVWAGSNVSVLARIRKSDRTAQFFALPLTGRDFLGNAITGIAAAPDGEVWIGTQSRGLFHQKAVGTDIVRATRTADNFPANQISDVTLDPAGVLWVATPFGLGRYADSTWSVISSGGQSNAFNKVHIDASGDPLAIVNYRAFGKLRGADWDWYFRHPSEIGFPTGSFVFAVTTDATGRIWIAIGAEDDCLSVRGVAMYDGSGWETYMAPPGTLSNGRISAIAVDALGHVWLTQARPPNLRNNQCDQFSPRLTRFDGQTWRLFSVEDTGIGSRLWTADDLLVDDAGTLWVATTTAARAGGGVVTYEDGEWKSLNRHGVGLRTLNVNEIVVSPDGTGWVATNAGLLKHNIDSVRFLHPNSSNFPSAKIYDIAIAADDEVWFATSAGLGKYDGLRYSFYTPDNSGLPGEDVLAVTVDGGGAVWAATRTRDLVRFDGSVWQAENLDDGGVFPGDVHAMVMARDNVLWMGLNNSGFVQDGVGTIHYTTGFAVAFDGNSFQNYQKNNSAMPTGEQFSGVKSMVLDSSGVLWISTQVGIVKFDRPLWQFYNRGRELIPEGPVKEVVLDPVAHLRYLTDTRVVSSDNTLVNLSGDDGPVRSVRTVTHLAIDATQRIWFAESNFGLIVLDVQVALGVDPREEPVPDNFVLLPNAPNPFRHETMIRFRVTESLPIQIEVFDMLGRRVREVANAYFTPGEHAIRFDARTLSAGMYFYRIQGPEGSLYRKMLILR